MTSTTVLTAPGGSLMMTGVGLGREGLVTITKTTALITFIIYFITVGRCEGVETCVRCEDVPPRTDCERKAPAPTKCDLVYNSETIRCMTAVEYNQHGAQLRFLRECTSLMTQRQKCTEELDKSQISQGAPAKTCYSICDTDGCNAAATAKFNIRFLQIPLLTSLSILFSLAEHL